MPVPSYRYPDLLQPRPQQLPSQFPSSIVDMLNPLVAQAWRSTGPVAPPQRMTPLGPIGGLLDQRAGVQVPLGAQGLLQPAMWDRARKEIGLLGATPYGTEGGGRGMVGGGGRGNTLAVTQNPPFEWSYSEAS